MRKGTKMSLEGRQRLSATRKRLFAEGLRVVRYRAPVCVPAVSADFGHWFAGFVAGEGCFSASRTPKGGLHLSFRIGLRADDRDVLVYIKEKLGFGIIVDRQRKFGTPISSYCVQSYGGRAALVALFEKFPLRAKKQADFEIWARLARRTAQDISPRYVDYADDVAALSQVKKFTQKGSC